MTPHYHVIGLKQTRYSDLIEGGKKSWVSRSTGKSNIYFRCSSSLIQGWLPGGLLNKV